MSKFTDGKYNQLITVAGNLAGTALSRGMSSGAGSALQGLSGVASAIPGPWGAIAGAGLGVLGGITNALWGSSINEGAVSAFKSANEEQANTKFDFSGTDDITTQGLSMLGNISKKEVGKEGLFSNKVTNLTKKLNAQRDMANQQMLSSFNMAAQNADQRNDFNALANFAAFGGHLLTHGADFDTGLTLIGNGGRHEENPLEGVPMGMDAEGIPNLVEEGEVIFNDYVFSNRLKVPKAVRKKYKLRGTKPITFAEAAIQMGKESEERPNDPISQGGLIDGMSKLIAEQEKVREKKAARKSRQSNRFDWGGNTLNSYGWDRNYNAGNWMVDGAYTDDYYNRVGNMTVDDWNQHLTDQRNYYNNEANRGTARWNVINYMYESNPWMKDYVATADDVGKMATLAKSKPGFMHPIDVLQRQLDAATKREKRERKYLTGRTDASGTPLEDLLIPDYDPNSGTYQYIRKGTSSEGDTDYTDYFYTEKPVASVRDIEPEPNLSGEDNGKYPNYDNWMRYMPLLGGAIGLGTSIFTKPDDSDASAILEASSGKGAYRPVRYRPVGNYLTYRPFDRNYYINKMNAEAGASRRSILNTAGGNRSQAMAGILAADNNYLNQLGNLARQAEEYNLAQRNQVEEFNRGTDIQNSEGFLKADMANQSALASARDFTLRGAMAAADIRSRARLAREQAISANLSNIFNSLGDIGKERVDRKWRAWASKHGVYAPVHPDEKRAHGGRIKRKKKGLTF